MAINTPANIKLAVGSFLNRSDLTALIPDFIELAQARLNREVRVPQMLTRSDLATVDAQYEDVPTGWLESVRFSLLTTPVQPLTYLTPEEMTYNRQTIGNSTGQPLYFSVAANTSGTNAFEFLPTPGAAYAASHLYYTAIDLTTTNWLLTSHPDIVLYGALCEAEPYVMHDERLPMWKAKYDEALASLKKSGGNRAISSTPSIRPRSFG
jgi:hypothetical protein